MPEVKDIVSYISTDSRRFVSNDGKTTYGILNYAVGEEDAKELTPDIRARIADQPPGIRASTPFGRSRWCCCC